MKHITQVFPLLALALSAVALWQPEYFISQKPLIVPLLMIIMLGMGLTLQWSDFKDVSKHPGLIMLGIGIQFLLMPLIAFGISKALSLPEAWMIGMVLVGSVAGGTASNVICHLSGGWVALSVSMTLASTLLSVVATPLLTLLYLGESVDVPLLSMILSICKIVILPIAIGTLVNEKFKSLRPRLARISPLVSVVGIVWIIAIVVALNASSLRNPSWAIFLAVILHNGFGLLLGYSIPRLLGRDSRIARTIAIEVGMQNSGMAVVLANQFFTAASALPGAIFSIWHNVSGSTLAAYWSKWTPSDKKTKA